MKELEKSLVKAIVALLTVGVLELGFMLYREAYIKTGQSNPIKQCGGWKKWNREHEKVFGQGGYADTNKDGILTFEEKASAYRLMGFDDYFRDDQDFPGVYPMSRLEKAIRRYEDSIL